MIEKSRVKFAKMSNGDIVGFVSRNPATNQLKGVREDSSLPKKVCVLSKDLKGSIVPKALYDVELKPMRNGNGYVVISAIRKHFDAQIELYVKPHKVYKVIVRFGNKVIYFDPVNGKSDSSRTLAGVLEELNTRQDIANPDSVISDVIDKAQELLRLMEDHGYHVRQ